MSKPSLRPAWTLCATLPLLCVAACKTPSEKKVVDTKTTTPKTALVFDASTPDAGKLALAPAPPLSPTPLGLPKVPSPSYNPTTPEKVALGALLFAEVNLSDGGKRACVSCHRPDHGWSSPNTVDDTAAGQLNLRHTPSLINLAYHQEYYWDGRSKPLEGHILGHWEGQLGSGPEAAVLLLLDNPLYAAHFARAFDTPANADRAADAIAAYVRTLLSGDSAWDRYENGESAAVSQDVIDGAKIFNVRAGCATCHTPPLYTDLRYYGIGVPDRELAPDLGRGKSAAEGPLFKTPGLRAATRSAPYFHNGSAKTFDEVLDIKEAMGSPALTPDERRKLLLFLAALAP